MFCYASLMINFLINSFLYEKWYLYNHFWQLSLSYSHYLFTYSLYFFDFYANTTFSLQINGCIKSCHKKGCSNNTTLSLFLSSIEIDTDTWHDIDTLTPITIWENDIIQCNHMCWCQNVWHLIRWVFVLHWYYISLICLFLWNTNAGTDIRHKWHSYIVTCNNLIKWINWM